MLILWLLDGAVSNKALLYCRPFLTVPDIGMKASLLALDIVVATLGLLFHHFGVRWISTDADEGRNGIEAPGYRLEGEGGLVVVGAAEIDDESVW